MTQFYMDGLYDCLIIGAGPAGSTAAYHLAKRGHRVAVLEKGARLGLKPCGGGVSPQVAQWFGFDLGPVVEARIRRCRFTLMGQEPVEFESEGRDILWMVRRERFDALLMAEAGALGAELMLSRPALGLTFSGEAWEVATPHGPLRGRYLVAADGAKGRSARWLGLGGRLRVGAALELEGAVAPPEDAPLCIDFGAVKAGYLWNFPKRDGQSLGIGTLDRAQGRTLRAILEPYARGFGIDPAAGTVVAHPIHVWNGKRLLHTRQALLAGEAACAVDPFTVEGIRPAIRTGVWAAEAVDAALAGRDGALDGYSLRFRELDREMRWARCLATLFFGMPATLYRTAVMSRGGPRAMARLLQGEATYQEVARNALAWLGGGFTAT